MPNLLKGAKVPHRVFINYHLPKDPAGIEHTAEITVDAPSKIIAAWLARDLWEERFPDLKHDETVTKVRVYQQGEKKEKKNKDEEEPKDHPGQTFVSGTEEATAGTL